MAVIGWLAACIADDAEAAESKATEDFYRSTIAPLLQQHCFDCHDEGSEIPLAESASPDGIAGDRQLWTRAINQVRLGTMPPADAEPIDADDRQALIRGLDRLANTVDCVRNPNAGRVALRRLNRHEYRNTIRDLTGVDYRPSENFPGDDVGYGFDNIGDVLSLPPILMEKYLDAAEEIIGRAIYTPPPPEIYELDRDPTSLVNAENFGGRSGSLTLASNGTVSLVKELPISGKFRLTISASGDQAGPEPCRMVVRCGGREQVFAVDNSESKDFVFEVGLGRGNRQFDISFVNDYYVAQPRQDRNLHIHHVRLEGTEVRRGPRTTTAEKPASHDELLFVQPQADISPDRATAEVIRRFASRAFRRPASDAEVKRLGDLARRVREDGGSFEEGVQVAMQAVLVSPYFLFKVERPRNVDAGQPMPPISQYELATRVSYFLWSSMPADELLLMAHRGLMRDQNRLLRKVASMLRDRRANRFVESFAGQWLQLRNLEDVAPDTRLFRNFDDEMRELMRRETLTFFASVMRANDPVSTLLDADYTYLNEKLSQFYGIRGVSGDNFRRVSLDGTPRGGLLTHASVLTVTSNPTRTSPVKRGKFILENLLNMPPPPAPPNVPELEKDRLVGTLRQRMEQHREDPSCAACHAMMDPLGFALENFDAVGRFRTRDGRDPIDPSGELPDGTSIADAGGLKTMLAVDRKDDFVRCFVEKLMIYAIGRGTEYYDRCAVDKIVAQTAKQDHRFAHVVAGIILSDPFQKQGFRDP